MIVGIDRSAVATALRIGSIRLFPDCVTWGGPSANWYYFGIGLLTPYQIEHVGRFGFDGTYYDGPHWRLKFWFFYLCWSLPRSTCEGLI